MKTDKGFAKSGNRVHPTLKFIVAAIFVAGIVFGKPHDAFADLIFIDTAFGTGGFVTTDIDDYNDFGNALTIQTDGKILVAGSTEYDEYYNNKFVVARFNSDGSLDTTFDSTGIVTTTVGTQGDDSARDIVILSNGKILVTGPSLGDNGYDFGLVQYNSDGSPDTGFGTNGIVTADYPDGSSHADTILIQSDDKILVGGGVDPYPNPGSEMVLARYLEDGNLDTTFSGDGFVGISFGPSYDSFGSMALQTDGYIVVVGSTDVGTDEDIVVLRYNTGGSLDPSFGVGGIVTLDIDGEDDYGGEVAIQSDGKILVTGSCYIDGIHHLVVARLTSTGTLDTSFNQNGMVLTPLGDYAYYSAIQILDNDKLLLSGTVRTGEAYDSFLARHNSNGSLDTTFNLSGFVFNDREDDDFCTGSAIQSDGKIVLVGSTNSPHEILVFRYDFSDSFDVFLPFVVKH